MAETSNDAKCVRILIADDNQLVRRGVIEILSAEPTWEICAEAVTGLEALQKSRDLRPDVVLLDVSMPGMSGLEVARRLRKDAVQSKILVVSHHDPSQLLPRALEAGADGCIDKGRLGIDLLEIVRKFAPVKLPHGGKSTNEPTVQH